MPIHDWTKVSDGDFHDFHQTWTPEIKRALNDGLLPAGYFAIIEQKSLEEKKRLREPDVLAIDTFEEGPITGGVLVADPPQTRMKQIIETESELYSRKANRVAIRHRRGRIVAIIEVVSPGNKHSQKSLQRFVTKLERFLREGVHVMLIDLFPPTRRDPPGVHKELIARFGDKPFDPPLDKPLMLASYRSGEDIGAFLEPAAVGDALPSMPLLICGNLHVSVPLEAAYRAAWANTIPPIQADLEGLSPAS